MPAKKPIKKPVRKTKAPVRQKFIELPVFSSLYIAFALLVTLASTIYWSLLSAKIQLGNSDQLVNADLFQNIKTFRDATFPGSHSFLIKWPIFLLIRLLGSSDSIINGFTVGLVLLTVGGLVYCLYRIEKRPLVFGTICLALSSVLLMIPAAPYAGAILPLNMSMLATRNIEYIIFILSIVLFMRSPRVRSWGFWLAAACLSLLIASDKLFLILAIGGALIALVIYAKRQSWRLVNIMANWLVVGAVASVGAILILSVINVSGLTHLSSQGTANPYNLTTEPKQLILGTGYAVSGILSNFGANPAFDATTVRSIPHQIYKHLVSLSGPAYIVNLAVMVVGLLVIYSIIRSSLTRPKRGQQPTRDKATALSIILIWSSFIAILSFVGTNHYYAVDARYLTIILFTAFIAFSAYSRTKQWQPLILVSAGLVLTVSVALGVVGATHSYNDDRNALAFENSNNTVVAHILGQHPTDVLVGDYWRVIPIKQVSSDNLTVLPLAGCTIPRQSLSSKAWQPDLNHTGFTYLLIIRGSLTDYPNCSLKQIVGAYGRPNASALIDGTVSNPNQILLFYDRGINNHPAKTRQPAQGPDTVLPVPISSLTNTTCPVESYTNIVAHQDDDLLFMNPDLFREIKAGDCVRSIYLTAGDDGQSQFYWLGREAGSEAAYSYMLGTKTIWIQKIVELSNHEFVTVANPKGNTKISLIFMHLPDGNLKGQGFSSSGYQSLAKLASGQIKTINSVDKQSYYSSAQLVSALSTLMNVYQTTAINTQAGVQGQQFPDHSDHLTVNHFVKLAYKQFETQKYSNQVTIPINYYIGYPIHQMAANVSGANLVEKQAIFLQYAKHDGSVCQTIQTCQQTPTYNAYLTREYKSAY